MTNEFDLSWLATDHEKIKYNAPACDYYPLRKSSAVHMLIYKKYKSALKHLKITQALLPQGDNGLPLEDDELVGVRSL